MEKDLISILDIYNYAILNTTAAYEYEAYKLEDRKQWYEKKKQEDYPVLVFEEDGKVIGFAAIEPFRPDPAYRYSVMHSVYVDHRSRGNGVGTALVKEIIRITNEKKYETLIAEIDGENEKSIKMHEKLGFKYSGTINKAAYKFGKWLDLSFYQFNLQGSKKSMY